MNSFHGNSWRYSIDLEGVDGDKSGANSICFFVLFIKVEVFFALYLCVSLFNMRTKPLCIRRYMLQYEFSLTMTTHPTNRNLASCFISYRHTLHKQ